MSSLSRTREGERGYSSEVYSLQFLERSIAPGKTMVRYHQLRLEVSHRLAYHVRSNSRPPMPLSVYIKLSHNTISGERIEDGAEEPEADANRNCVLSEDATCSGEVSSGIPFALGSSLVLC